MKQALAGNLVRPISAAGLPFNNVRRCMSSSAKVFRPELQSNVSPNPTTQIPPAPPLSSSSSDTKKKQSKEEGTIASVFATLSGGSLEDALPDRFSSLKRSLIASPNHEQHLKQAWKQVLSSVSDRVSEISRLGGQSIPELEFPDHEIASTKPLSQWMDKATYDAIKDRGVAVIKNVVPASQALQWKEEIRAYAKANNAKGFPADNPQVYELYWSKPQLDARSHSSLLNTSKAFLQLFHTPTESPDSSASTTRSTSTPSVDKAVCLSQPLTYADRLRIRQPGDAKFALGPHIDGGGVERWECPNFRSLWSNILQENRDWKSHDPWSLGTDGERMTAKTDMYDGPGQCGVFRPLQGWLSLSSTKANEGTLRILPFLKESTAYIILRPFFRPRLARSHFDRESDYLASENWYFDPESRNFPGCSLGHNIELSHATHPHLDLEKTMTSIPKVEPGDMVLWHCDAVHSVEASHRGKSDSSVMYIPAIPTTKGNWEYVIQQKHCFQEGIPPPDFPGGEGEQSFNNRGKPQNIDDPLARQAMGLERFDTSSPDLSLSEKMLLEWCNSQI